MLEVTCMETEMMLQTIRNGKNTSSVREFCMNVRYVTIFTILSDTLILVLLSVLDDVTQLEHSCCLNSCISYTNFQFGESCHLYKTEHMIYEILKQFSQDMFPVVACIFLPGDYHDPEPYKRNTFYWQHRVLNPVIIC
jgi:hypothetical protein